MTARCTCRPLAPCAEAVEFAETIERASRAYDDGYHAGNREAQRRAAFQLDVFELELALHRMAAGITHEAEAELEATEAAALSDGKLEVFVAEREALS